MTSSKSFRASLFPSSFSFSALRSSSEGERRSRKLQRRISSPDPFKQQQPSSHAAADDFVRFPGDKDAPTPPGEPAASPTLRSKSRGWSRRISLFFPPLTSHGADSEAQPMSRRPTTAATVRPSETPPLPQPPPPPPPPPPPYDAHDASASYASSVAGSFEPASEPRTPPPLASTSSTVASLPELNFDELDISGPATHQILSPSSPVMDMAPVVVDDPKKLSLQTDHAHTRRRSSTFQYQSPLPDPQPRLQTRSTSPMPTRGRRSNPQTPTVRTEDEYGTPVSSSPVLRAVSTAEHSSSPSSIKVRRSWLPGVGNRSRSHSTEVRPAPRSYAWILDDDAQPEYNPASLMYGDKVPELWNEGGTVLVFLYPKESGRGPSFKVPEFTVSSSYVFNELMVAELEAPSRTRSHARSFGGRDNLRALDAGMVASPPVSPPPPQDWLGCMRLYLPTAFPAARLSAYASARPEGSTAELDRLIGIRNLFAFLTGQPLVGTRSRPTTFDALIQLADLLPEFGFSDYRGDTFGEAVDLSFSFYSEQLGLADCRHSRARTLEALILGERLRCLDLYNEAFAHAAGKYEAIMELRTPLFDQLSPLTRQQLERAHLDLVNRQHSVNEHLEQFDFPSLFAGIANSTSIPELRQVRFKAFRNSFHRMRTFVLGYYKATFGSWPPKASNKKNPFAESGLNRIVLKLLYSDMCALYDLLVDRTSMTSRTMDEVPAISSAADKMTTSALRIIMSEFDRSRPPVLPPIPFDLPQLPSMTSIHETFSSLSVKNQNRFEKRIKEHEMRLVLNKAYNYDTNSIRLPFLEQFKIFEMREARGRTCQDLADQRIGYWLFLYGVLQSLPMLVVDAPGLKYADGVEYFLCEPPMGNAPWVGDRQVRKMWYEVTGSEGRLVELSADAVMFSVEATYLRSHCWLAAKEWEEMEADEEAPMEEPVAMSPLEPPPSVFPGSDVLISSPSSFGASSCTPSPPPGGLSLALRQRTVSPGMNRASSAWRSSIALGLEPVPMEPSGLVEGYNRSSSLGPRPSSSYVAARCVSVGNLAGLSRSSTPTSQAATSNSGATFDDILGRPDEKSDGRKKGGFFR
ncbi:hypothetical protein RJ55_02499 [Drechmeria coniospora]|nr:hypothetical protein RJ55_02499 [Drechmeria coniospora]